VILFFLFLKCFLLDIFLYLHFKCYPLFWLPLWKPRIPFPLPLLTNPPTPASLSCHSPILGHRAFTGWRASPPIDAWQDHPLLHMWLEPWVPLCVLFGLWSSSLGAFGDWLVAIVVPPMRLQTPSAPLVLSLAPSLGTPCSVQFLIYGGSHQHGCILHLRVHGQPSASVYLHTQNSEAIVIFSSIKLVSGKQLLAWCTNSWPNMLDICLQVGCDWYNFVRLCVNFECRWPHKNILPDFKGSYSLNLYLSNHTIKQLGSIIVGMWFLVIITFKYYNILRLTEISGGRRGMGGKVMKIHILMMTLPNNAELSQCPSKLRGPREYIQSIL
jgi:hypothetical protein